MQWWDFNDISFICFFAIICASIIVLMFLILSFLIDNKRTLSYLNKINSVSNSTRIFSINMKQNSVIYFNRSNMRHKKPIQLNEFYSIFHLNDIEKVKSWIFSICVDVKSAPEYLEADIMRRNKKNAYFALLKLIKYDPSIGVIHLESHLLKYTAPTNETNKKRRGMPIGVVKRSFIENIINNSKSLKGFTFAIRFFHVKQKVLSNEKIERYMIMALKNVIYPFASEARRPRQIYEASDNELFLFDLRLTSKDEAYSFAIVLKQILKRCIGVNGFTESISFSIGIVENSLFYQEFDSIINKGRETCMAAQQSGDNIKQYQKVIGQDNGLEKYEEQIENLIRHNNLRYLYRLVADVSRKKVLGYFAYVKGYDTPFASYNEMGKYAAMVGKNRELFAIVAKNIISKFDNEKPFETCRLFFHASLYDVDHMIDIIPQIFQSTKNRIVLVFDEQEINENANQLEYLDKIMKNFHSIKLELALLMKDKSLLLNPQFYNNFDFFIAGTTMVGEIKKNNRIRLSIHSLIEQLLKYKKPIIATDLDDWQAVELIIKSGITLVSGNPISPANDMLLPIEKKKLDKLVAMDDSFH